MNKFHGLSKGVVFLKNNPAMLTRKIVARVKFLLLSAFLPLIRRQTSALVHFGPVQLELDLRDRMMRRMMTGDYDFEVRYVIRKYLQKGDVFLDVGANIGYFSALAARIVGASGSVHSFEPVSVYFNKLQTLADNNPLDNIFVHKLALGQEKGTTTIWTANDGNIGWNTVVPGAIKPEFVGSKEEVQVVRLDEYLFEHSISNVGVVKIDVEGFEYPVLKGFERFLHSQRPFIVCEVTPSAYHLLGSNVSDMLDYMASFSYQPYSLHTGVETRISDKQLQSFKQCNVLFKP